MSKLHELLAVEGDLGGTYKKIISETANTFSKKDNHFMGRIRTLSMFDESRKNEDVADEQQEMVTTVSDKLAYARVAMENYIDVTFQKDLTNQQAVADVTVDGVKVIENAPATWLLNMETRLKNIRELYELIPTLPPQVEWVKDDSRGSNVFSMAKPDESMRTEKKFKVQVLYKHTDKHPAQVEKIPETEAVGKYTRQVWTGKISPAQKSVLIGRIDKLLRAVKKARQRANCQEVVVREAGKAIFDYIHAE